MKRFGFTLAEVLISMTIIGVISALTLPTFIANYHTVTAETTRDVAVSNLEKVLGAMIVKEDVADLFETKAWRALGGTALNSSTDDSKRKAFLSAFGKTMAIAKFISKSEELGMGGASFMAKNGVVYNLTISNPSTYSDLAGTLVIDVNGSKGPNTVGKDRYEFNIASDGTITSK